jgi:hypothetical protein
VNRSVGHNIRSGEGSLKKTRVQYLFGHNKWPGKNTGSAKRKSDFVQYLRRTVAVRRGTLLARDRGHAPLQVASRHGEFPT